MPRSSARSASVGSVGATWVPGMRRLATAAATNRATASASTPGESAMSMARPAGIAAAKPTIPERSCSLELASTSSSSVLTTVGTRAARATV